MVQLTYTMTTLASRQQLIKKEHFEIREKRIKVCFPPLGKQW